MTSAQQGRPDMSAAKAAACEAAISIISEFVGHQRIDKKAIAVAVRFAFGMKDVPRRRYRRITLPRTKAQKVLARAVATTLRRLQHLVNQMEREYPAGLIGALLPPKQIERWALHCEALGRARLDSRHAQV
jgi:hypothetical protein